MVVSNEQTDLPTLGVFNSGKAALRNVCDVTLQNIPKLTELTLRSAFMGVKMLRMAGNERRVAGEEEEHGHTTERTRGEESEKREGNRDGCRGSEPAAE